VSVVNLLFSTALGAVDSGAVDLRFGFAEAVTIEARVLRSQLTTPAPKLIASLPYSANVVRLVTYEADTPWGGAEYLPKVTGDAWQLSATHREASSQPWGTALPAAAETALNLEHLHHLPSEVSPGWQSATKLSAPGLTIGVNYLNPSRASVTTPWQTGKLTSVSAGLDYVILKPLRKEYRTSWGYGKLLSAAWGSRFSRGVFTTVSKKILWQSGRRPPPGRSADNPIVVPPVKYAASTLLKFQCKYTGVNPRGVNLNFGLHPCPDTGLLIPIRKVYFIVNEVSLKRISDNVPIHFTSVSAGTDDDSWCWGFTASVPYSELEKIEPTASGPVEVELAINSQVWRFAIEGYTDDEEFAKTNITVKGRSLTAYLEDPYAPTRSFKQATALNSRQFAESELTRPGLVTGYSLDWQLIDSLGWLMPADTWSYSELTPIQVIQNIVQGAGGYVNSHPADKQLLVKAKYPTPYWEWPTATGLLTIPRSFVKRQSLEWHEKPAYNGVYVSGENTGVTAFVKRTGTAGEFQAPMFVNPMISAASAARNKGMSILSAGGKQATVSLDLPMEASLGLVSPGVMVEVTNGGLGTAPAWRGIVRSSSVAANWGRGLTVNQSLRVERHYGS
jgi:hypothetical protein